MQAPEQLHQRRQQKGQQERQRDRDQHLLAEVEDGHDHNEERHGARRVGRTLAGHSRGRGD